MISDITIGMVINGWTWDCHLDTLMWQCEETRCIVDKLEKLTENNKLIIKSCVIGLLGRKLNNYLLDKYSVEEYLEGIDRLCQYYNNYHNQPNEELVVKKTWMKNKHRIKFFN